VFIKYPHGKQSVPIRHVVPNFITSTSLCCGLASIHSSLLNDFDRAIIFVILAAVFDALDGRAARLLKVSSPFGAVLDSLADFLSFGVAPAILLHKWMLGYNKEMPAYDQVFGLAAAMMFVLCSGLRLARFTAGVKPSRQPHEAPTPEELRSSLLGGTFFTGMPTPAAAAAVLVPPMLCYSNLFGERVRMFFGVIVPQPAVSDKPGILSNVARVADVAAVPSSPWILWTVILYTGLIAFMMVSRIPMFSFKKVKIRKTSFVPLMLCAGAVVVLATRDTWLAMSVVALGYLFSMALSILRYREIMSRPLESFTHTGGLGSAHAKRVDSV
jgi:CDP-diacylglycerol--serine O-phosphatidyltransferase